MDEADGTGGTGRVDHLPDQGALGLGAGVHSEVRHLQKEPPATPQKIEEPGMRTDTYLTEREKSP